MKKIIKIILILFSIIFLVALFFYVNMGGLIGKIDFKGLAFFSIFIIIIIPIALVIYFILKLPLYVRAIRMKRLARKFNFNFYGEKYLFKLKQPLDLDKINVISGVINGHKIVIYDYVIYDAMSESSQYYTSFIKDEKKSEIEGLFWGFPSIRTIKKWLRSLQEGRDYDFKNSYFLKLFFRFIMVIILLLVLLSLVYIVPIVIAYVSNLTYYI